MNTRDKILHSSKEIFNELGFGTPTLNTLSQSIGISRGNLTYYFKDKDALKFSNILILISNENSTFYIST